ncbi:hypothetical protein AKO1_007548 [Acrasis kona]|uniref:Uncharacterized protein n=1 Tax=Acrasis kona TaxID=1008807 RepID=A0AAW2YRR7_9EUKA
MFRLSTRILTRGIHPLTLRRYTTNIGKNIGDLNKQTNRISFLNQNHSDKDGEKDLGERDLFKANVWKGVFTSFLLAYLINKYLDMKENLKILEDGDGILKKIKENTDLSKLPLPESQMLALVIPQVTNLLLWGFIPKVCYDKELDLLALTILERNYESKDENVMRHISNFNHLIRALVMVETDYFADRLIQNDAIVKLSEQHIVKPSSFHRVSLTSFFYKDSLKQNIINRENVLKALRRGCEAPTQGQKNTFDLCVHLLLHDVKTEDIPPILTTYYDESVHKKVIKKNQTLHILFNHRDSEEKFIDLGLFLIYVNQRWNFKKVKPDVVSRRTVLVLPFFVLMCYFEKPLRKFVHKLSIQNQMQPGMEQPSVFKFMLLEDSLCLFWVINYLAAAKIGHFVNLPVIYYVANVWNIKYWVRPTNESKPLWDQ